MISTARVTGGLALIALAAVAGCAKPNYDDRITGSIARDYRERHPIVVTDQTRVLDVPVGIGDAVLPNGTRETILGFLARYRAESEGVIQISRPVGAGNEATAAAAAAETAELLSLAGVDHGLIVRTTYDAGGASSGPIRLAYTAIRAQVANCGQWPEDLTDGKLNHDNRSYHNFGCATQANMAAQIANPTDLLHPRAPSPIDAGRENAIIADARADGNPASGIGAQ